MFEMFRRSPVVGVPDKPDVSRICDFPEARHICRRIETYERDWFLIDGQPGLYRKGYGDGELRARYKGEVLWFSRDRISEKSIHDLHEIINKSEVREAVA